jgi:hypothetical protein
VSNTVSFVLVFSLIVSSVGIVTTAGFDSLQDVQESQQAESSAALMRSAGAGINGVANGERPSFRSSLALSGGQLAVTNETTVGVEVSNATGTPLDETYRPGALSYRANDRNVTYQSGLLARGAERRRAVLLAGAGFRCVPGDYATVTLVRVRSDDGPAVAGGPVTVEASDRTPRPPQNRSGPVYPTNTTAASPTGVVLTVDGPYERAWEDALTDRGFSTTGSGGLECSADRVYVRAPTVGVGLS